MTSHQELIKNFELIRAQAPDMIPKIGIILGSGVGNFVTQIQKPLVIPYEKMPAMRPCRVEGHVGRFYLGTIKNMPIACFQGRNHFYEGYPPSVLQVPVRLLKLLGAEILIIISAVGAISRRLKTGSLVTISDHINFQFINPLIGLNEEIWGPRFPDMEQAYDIKMRQHVHNIAEKLGLTATDAVYAGVTGPSFETPAEIRAFGILGADVVGMSTVPEVITARHCGIKVLAMGVVTNMAAGITGELIDHNASLEVAEKSVHSLSNILITLIGNLGADYGEL